MIQKNDKFILFYCENKIDSYNRDCPKGQGMSNIIFLDIQISKHKKVFILKFTHLFDQS